MSSEPDATFGVWDYLVLSAMLAVSASIGIYYRCEIQVLEWSLFLLNVVKTCPADFFLKNTLSWCLGKQLFRCVFMNLLKNSS